MFFSPFYVRRQSPIYSLCLCLCVCSIVFEVFSLIHSADTSIRSFFPSNTNSTTTFSIQKILLIFSSIIRITFRQKFYCNSILTLCLFINRQIYFYSIPQKPSTILNTSFFGCFTITNISIHIVSLFGNFRLNQAIHGLFFALLELLLAIGVR